MIVQQAEGRPKPFRPESAIRACMAKRGVVEFRVSGTKTRQHSTHERFFRGKTAKISECEEARPSVRAHRARLRLAFFARRLAVPPSENLPETRLFFFLCAPGHAEAKNQRRFHVKFITDKEKTP